MFYILAICSEPCAILYNTTAGCGEPIPPSRGSIDNFQSAAEGATITYSCSPGLVPRSQMSAVCTNMTWRPDPATLQCMEPGEYCMWLFRLLLSSLVSVAITKTYISCICDEFTFTTMITSYKMIVVKLLETNQNQFPWLKCTCKLYFLNLLCRQVYNTSTWYLQSWKWKIKSILLVDYS